MTERKDEAEAIATMLAELLQAIKSWDKEHLMPRRFPQRAPTGEQPQQGQRLITAFTPVTPPPAAGEPPTPEPEPLDNVLVIALTRDVGSTAGGTVLNIAGSGFVVGAIANFGGTDATITGFNSATSLTATVPAHAAGLVDVRVTVPDTSTSTLQTSGAHGFEYLPAPTTTYITHGFEDGLRAPFTGKGAVPTVDEFAVGANSGTFAAKCKKSRAGSGTSALVHSRADQTPTNPPLEATGVYQRWYQLIEQDVIDALVAGTIKQIKLLLNRGGPGAWLQGIIGVQSGANNNLMVVMLQDANTGILPPSTGFVVKVDPIAANSASHTGFIHPANVWVEFQTSFFHDGIKGRARLWIDGKEFFDVLGGTGTRNNGGPCTIAASPEGCLGTDDSSGVYDWEIGVAFVQGNTSDVDAVVYLDDAAMANGYIDP